MKKSLIVLLTIALICALSVTVFAINFSDISSHWAKASIERLVDEKVINGYADGTFNPDGSITRAEYVAMIVRIFEPTKTSDISSYKDVSKNAWYYEAIQKGVAMGIIEGDSARTMRPDANITRQEAMVGLNRVLLFKASGDMKLSYTDAKEIATWATSDVKALTAYEYVNGYEDSTVRPERNITRAETAKMLDNAIGKIITKAGEYDLKDVEGCVVVKVKNVKLKNTKNVDKIFVANDDVKSTVEAENIAKKDYIVISQLERRSSSGRSSGGSSSSKTEGVSIVLTHESGDKKYTVTRKGEIAEGSKLTIKIDDVTIVDAVVLSEENYKSKKDDALNTLVTYVLGNDENVDELLIQTLQDDYSSNTELQNMVKTFIATLDGTPEGDLVARIKKDLKSGKSYVETYNSLTTAEARQVANTLKKVDYKTALDALKILAK